MNFKRSSGLLGKLAPVGALAIALSGMVGCGGAGGDPTTEGAGQDPTSQTTAARAGGSPAAGATGSNQTSTGQTTSTGVSNGSDATGTAPAPASPTGAAGDTDATGSTTTASNTAPAAGTAPAASTAQSGSTAQASSTAPAAAAPAAAAPAAAAPAAGGTGTIVPLYSAPGSGTWSAVAAAKRAHPSVPILAVINPNNGPGTAAQSDYMAGISELTSAGVKVIGYVYTSYGARAASEVEADMGRWRNLYPGVSGIFFDEMVNKPGQEGYYSGLTKAAKAKGLDFTIGNPGSDGGPSYVGTVDTILIYESPGLPSGAALAGWHSAHERHNFGVIPYGIPSMDAAFVASAKASCGYIFLQNDVLPNPWDTLPPYFDALIAALA